MSGYADNDFMFSVITELECLSYSKLSKSDEANIKDFFKSGKIKNISRKIKKETINIRKKYGLKLPDAIIAATAITSNVPLISADKVFSKVQELDFTLLVPQ